MTDQPCVVALSADFTRIEASLVSVAGKVIHTESAPLRITPRGAARYVDPAGLFDVAAAAIHNVLEAKPREARHVIGVSLVGRSTSVVPVTSDGAAGQFVLAADAHEPCGPASNIPWDTVYDAVGLTRRRFEIPPSMKASAGSDGVFLTPKDYLKWALTGEYSTDPLDAQRTFLYDLSKRAWSPDLCAVFGVDMRRLPPVMPATHRAGAVTAAGARATGLKIGLPVACGMGDWGEYLGAGAFEEGDAFEHIGATGAFYGVTGVRAPRDLGLDVRPHISDGLYLCGREGLPGGECLEWLVANTSLARGGNIDWKAVDEELETVGAMGKPENVLFFPSLGGGSGPVGGAAFLNLHAEDNLTSFIQALIEGLFFTLKSVADQVKRLPWEPKAIYTTGKIAFKHGPRRIRANIYGARVHAGRRPGANVTTAAIVGATAFGAYGSIAEARRRMLDTDGGVAPVEHARRLYEGHFVKWLGTRDFLDPSR